MDGTADLHDIALLGGNAHQLGFGLIDNPYLRREHLPQHTGESYAQWQQKVDAWKAGWEHAAASAPPSIHVFAQGSANRGSAAVIVLPADKKPPPDKR